MGNYRNCCWSSRKILFEESDKNLKKMYLVMIDFAMCQNEVSLKYVAIAALGVLFVEFINKLRIVLC